jgi:hypothetical protein
LDVAGVIDSTVAVLINDGTGNFVETDTDVSALGAPAAITVVDVNHDGFADIGLVLANTPTLVVLTGDGDGNFAVTPYPTMITGTSITSGDFNNDKVIDFAIVDQLGDVAIVTGVAAGGYLPPGPPFIIPAGNASSIATADFDGDGYLDLAIVNSSLGSVSVLRNAGDGTFPTHNEYAVGADPQTVQIADVTTDGFADLVVDNAFDATISVLAGQGNGAFSPQVAYGASAGLAGLQVGDVDNDGRIDIINLNGMTQLGGVVGGTTMLNTCLPAPKKVIKFHSKSSNL